MEPRMVWMQVWGRPPIAVFPQGILPQKTPGGSRTPAWLPQTLVSEDHTWENHGRKSPCPLLKRGGLATCLWSPHLSPLPGVSLYRSLPVEQECELCYTDGRREGVHNATSLLSSLKHEEFITQYQSNCYTAVLRPSACQKVHDKYRLALPGDMVNLNTVKPSVKVLFPAWYLGSCL